MSEQKAGQMRSSCLRIGIFLVIPKILNGYKLPEILGKYLGKKETGLFLDLAAYSLISENNAAQYYPSYAYSHPLFTKQMHIYSDSKVSDFLAELTDDQRVGFVNEWNENRDHREKIYISYDSTNKNCQARDLRFVEFGHPKDDRGLLVFNYSIALVIIPEAFEPSVRTLRFFRNCPSFASNGFIYRMVLSRVQTAN